MSDVEQAEMPPIDRIKKADMVGMNIDLIDMSEPFLVKGLKGLSKVKSIIFEDLADGHKYSTLVTAGSAMDRPEWVGERVKVIQIEGEKGPYYAFDIPDPEFRKE